MEDGRWARTPKGLAVSSSPIAHPRTPNAVAASAWAPLPLTGLMRMFLLGYQKEGPMRLMAALFLLVAQGALAQQWPATAFVNVSVLPMDEERVLAGQTVLV